MSNEIILKLPPFSINAMYYSDLRAKTPEAREWSGKVLWQLNSPDNQLVITPIRETFDPKQHVFSLKTTVYYPHKIFFNKEGTLSGRTQDISNFEKPILDLLFGPKYFGTNPPFQVQNINADDRYVYQNISTKLPHSEDYHIIKLEVQIVDIENLKSLVTV